MRLSRGSCSKCGRFLSLTMCLRGDLIRPHKQDTPQTEPSKALTKHIQNVKDQTRTLCTMHQGWVLPLSKGVEDAVNAKNKKASGESSCGIVSRFYRKGICDITDEHEGGGSEYCSKHLSILSLSLFFIVCSRKVGAYAARRRRSSSSISAMRAIRARSASSAARRRRSISSCVSSLTSEASNCK